MLSVRLSEQMSLTRVSLNNSTILSEEDADRAEEREDGRTTVLRSADALRSLEGWSHPHIPFHQFISPIKSIFQKKFTCIIFLIFKISLNNLYLKIVNKKCLEKT